MKKLIVLLTGIVVITSVCAQPPKPGKTQIAKADTTKSAVKTDSVKAVVTKDSTKADTAKLLEITLTELAKYNGTNGMPAYVAVDGIIYDETSIDSWKGGKHEGYRAGKDITKEIKKISPHGTSVLKKRKVVGKIIPEKTSSEPVQK
jgi:predicted heme/steroid binding protein